MPITGRLRLHRDGRVWCSLGGFVCDAGRWDQAIECYETALESGLTEHQIFVDLGLAYREQGDSLWPCLRISVDLRLIPETWVCGQEALIQADLCDWSDFKNLRQTLLEPTLAFPPVWKRRTRFPLRPMCWWVCR